MSQYSSADPKKEKNQSLDDARENALDEGNNEKYNDEQEEWMGREDH